MLVVLYHIQLGDKKILTSYKNDNGKKNKSS